MTTATATDATDDRQLVLPDLGHPVRSFLLAALVLALLLAAAGYTGIAAPRVSSWGSGGGGPDADGRMRYFVQLHTDAAVDVRVLEATFVDPAWGDIEVGVFVGETLMDPTHFDAFEPFDLAEDDPVWISVSGIPRCGFVALNGRLEVRVRSWMGIERTVAFQEFDSTPHASYCAEPSTSWTSTSRADSSRSLRAAAA